MIPLGVIQVRKELCALCSDKAHDPCATCEHGQWGQYESTGCDDPDREEPPLSSSLVMAGSAVASMVQVATRGSEPVSEDEQKRRKQICFECEWYRMSDDRCAKCGCYLNYKTRLKAWHCPIKKW